MAIDNALDSLREYVMKYTTRGPCQCGRCSDAVPAPETKQPQGRHTVDLYFFHVSLRNAEDGTSATAENLLELIQQSRTCISDTTGEPLAIEPDSEYNYMALGGWIGDQGIAMMFMGMCHILELGSVITPNIIPGIPKELKDQMAGAGMVSIIMGKMVIKPK